MLRIIECLSPPYTVTALWDPAPHCFWAWAVPRQTRKWTDIPLYRVCSKSRRIAIWRYGQPSQSAIPFDPEEDIARCVTRGNGHLIRMVKLVGARIRKVQFTFRDSYIFAKFDLCAVVWFISFCGNVRRVSILVPATECHVVARRIVSPWTSNRSIVLPMDKLLHDLRHKRLRTLEIVTFPPPLFSQPPRERPPTSPLTSRPRDLALTRASELDCRNSWVQRRWGIRGEGPLADGELLALFVG